MKFLLLMHTLLAYLPFSVFYHVGYGTHQKMSCLIQTHKGITSNTHCTSFTYHNQDFQILANKISATSHIIYEIDSTYILLEKNYIKILYLTAHYLLEVLMMKHFK